ncbi:myosin-1-like isoform X2 [Humulus lupulus]|nr:myosin-1-like isoform X2 [Humulus lupulus]XP_062115979.1 myosin-1-like isoform X2 [Humulus lupulus]
MPSLRGSYFIIMAMVCLSRLLVKLQSWFQCPNGKWELAKILSISGTESVIALPDEKVLKVQTESLVPANPDILDGVDDLM